jgi:hypothetical protein
MQPLLLGSATERRSRRALHPLLCCFRSRRPLLCPPSQPPPPPPIHRRAGPASSAEATAVTHTQGRSPPTAAGPGAAPAAPPPATSRPGASTMTTTRRRRASSAAPSRRSTPWARATRTRGARRRPWLGRWSGSGRCRGGQTAAAPRPTMRPLQLKRSCSRCPKPCSRKQRLRAAAAVVVGVREAAGPEAVAGVAAAAAAEAQHAPGRTAQQHRGTKRRRRSRRSRASELREDRGNELRPKLTMMRWRQRQRRQQQRRHQRLSRTTLAARMHPPKSSRHPASLQPSAKPASSAPQTPLNPTASIGPSRTRRAANLLLLRSQRSLVPACTRPRAAAAVALVAAAVQLTPRPRLFWSRLWSRRQLAAWSAAVVAVVAAAVLR